MLVKETPGVHTHWTHNYHAWTMRIYPTQSEPSTPVRHTVPREMNLQGMILVSDLLHKYIDGLVQDCSNSSVLAMELLQSCAKPSIPPKAWVLFVVNTDLCRPQSGSWHEMDKKLVLFLWNRKCQDYVYGLIKEAMHVESVAVIRDAMSPLWRNWRIWSENATYTDIWQRFLNSMVSHFVMSSSNL